MLPASSSFDLELALTACFNISATIGGCQYCWRGEVMMSRHALWIAVAACILSVIAPIATSAADLATVQKRLNEIGFDVGTPDGKFGSRTKYAIEAFQSSHGQPMTGRLSQSDLDLLFSDQAAVRASAPVVGSNFEILRDTDIPYGDYRSGKEDPGLKGISLERCQAACQSESQCQAFTYNQRYKFCFLKDKISSTSAFKGATSGRRLVSGEVTVAEAASPAGLIGAPKGCPAQVAVVDRMRHNITVAIDATSAVVGAGKGVTLRWSRGDLPERLPIFLMVSTSRTVRFAGKNFYALTPNANAAFDFKQFSGTTRAVIPLFGAAVPQQGTIQIDPLTEGTLDLAWDVVGMTDCGEQASGAPQQLQVTVAAGAPAIVFQNPFTTQVPKERIASPAGNRTIDAFDGYYRLYDNNGYLIAELPGVQPRFSLTGRFVSAWTGDYVNQMIDSFDGKLITEQSGIYAIGWYDADSFFVASANRWAMSEVGSPLAGQDSFTSIGYGCHACTSLQEGMRFDLANNLILIKDGAASLTTNFSQQVDRSGETSQADIDKVLVSVRAQQQVAATALPPDEDNGFNWQFGTDRPLTSIISNVALFGDQKIPPEPFLEAHAAPVLNLPVDVPVAIGAAGQESTTQIAVRGPARVFSKVQGSGLQHVTEALSSLTFSAKTPVVPSESELQIIHTKDYRRTYQLEALPKFPLVGPAQGYDGCLPDADHQPGDHVILGVDLRTLPLRTTKRFSVINTGCAAGSAAFMDSSTLLFDRTQPGTLRNLTSMFMHEDAGPAACQHMLGDCGFDLRVFDDRFVIFSSPLSNALAVYDGDQHKLIASYAALPRSRMIRDLTIDKTGRWLVLYFTGDLFSLLDLSINQRPNSDRIVSRDHAADPVVLEGMVADNELIVWTNKLGFDATAEGAEFVSVRFAGRSDVYALTQFETALREKDLFSRVITGTLASASTRRVAPPPAIASAKVAVGADGTSLDIGLDWGHEQLSKLTVLQDGLVTDTVDLAQKVGATSFTTPRMRGAKWVTLVAQDSADVASRPYSTSLPADPRGSRSVRLVAVGIDRYEDPRLPTLALSRPDAGNIEKALAALPSVTLTSAQTLIDEATTSTSIRAAIAAAIDTSTLDDTLVLSFSGHGISDAAGNLYLATRDTRLDDIAHTAIPWTDIAAMISKTRGRVIVFLDTCHSGIAGTAYAAPSEGAVEDFLTAIPSNLLIFSASKGREFSQERAALGGGVFTNALVKALGADHDVADSNRDGVLEISELYGYLRLTVARETEGQQTPWFARNKMVGDFAVF
jgi:hypothetical protein